MSELEPTREGRRFAAVNRFALGLFCAAPLAGGAVVAALLMLSYSSEAAMAAGVLAVASVWGFLGALSWVTAAGVQTTAEALTSVTEHRRLLKSAETSEEAGQLSVASGGAEGALSEADRGEVSKPLY